MPTEHTHELVIRTPEGVAFSLPLAGPFSRLLALAVDTAAVGAMTGIAAALLRAFVLFSPDVAMALTTLAAFVLELGYAMALEYLWRGQTLGKRLLRIRVMDASALRLEFGQVAIRNLLRVVDCLPFGYLVGGVAVLVSPRAQRLGDLAAGTVVVRLPDVREPALDQLAEVRYNSLLAHQHLAARLRHTVSAQEAALALRALLRRDRLEPAARVTLFERLAAHFRERVPFPAEAVHGVSDEQYVRNVVDVLFRSA